MANGQPKRRGEDEMKDELHGCAYVLHCVVLFLAVWFRCHRVEEDGEGDVDPENVQIWLAEKGWLGEKPKEVVKERAAVKRCHPSRDEFQATAEAEQRRTAEGVTSSGTHGVASGDAVDGAEEGEVQEEAVLAEAPALKGFPVFIAFECTYVFLLWFMMALIKHSKEGTQLVKTKAGMDSIVDGMTDLRMAGDICEDYRGQVWRWLTYQFTHDGADHVILNIVMTLVLGVPLEWVHGSWLVAIMFNVGVFGGACCYFVGDAHNVVVGCSGGWYALAGIHVADVFTNWHRKQFRLVTAAVMLLIVCVDVLGHALSMDSGNTNHATHVGGAVSGLITGMLVCKKPHGRGGRRVVAVAYALLGLALAIASLGWTFSQEGGPLNVFEAAAGEGGWCWKRQVLNATFGEGSWVCVRCGTAACIREWSRQENIFTVNRAACHAMGYYYDGR